MIQVLPVSICLVLIWAITRKYAPNIYNFLILKMTSKWYRRVLLDVPENCEILDIGIGPGSALVANRETLLRKNIKVTGVDYDRVYINYAEELIKRDEELRGKLDVHCLSIYAENLGNIVLGSDENEGNKKLFDAVYFSGSFSLLPDPMKALKIADKLLTANGVIYITQTYQKRYIFGMRFLKPLLRYLTTIDFGQLVYEHELENLLKKSEFRILVNEVMSESNHWMSADEQWQSARFIKMARM